MKKKTLCAWLIALFFAWIFCTGKKSVQDDTASVLPESGIIPQWEKTGELNEYVGDDLYVHINGGAEIYHEYGFNKVMVQEYTGPGEKSIIVELFEMKDNDAAYGIYSFKKGNKGEALEIPAFNQFENYYLNMQKGNIHVTITGFDSDEVTISGLKAVAGFIAEKIDEPLSRPELINKFPSRNNDPVNIKFYTGYLGLYNSYPFSTGDIFSFSLAAKATYTALNSDLFILEYVNEPTCSDNFDNVQNSMKTEASYSGFSPRNDGFTLKDEKDNTLFFKKQDKYICISIGSDEVSNIENLFDQIQ